MPAKCSSHLTLPPDPEPLFVNGELEFKAHQVGFIVCGGLSLIASLTSAWLISKHLAFYTKPLHQRHIVRLLLMVPVYAWISFLSYFFWEQALYFQLIRDCYEAIVVGSFFYLIVYYLAETPAALGALFRNFQLDKWMWPFGGLKYRPSTGWHFYQICRFCVLQYVVLRPLSTLVAVITQALGYYCLDSWSVVYYHVWNTIIISISVSVALYFLLQIFTAMPEELKPYKPMIKFLSIKAVVFVIFWQATLLAVLEYYELGIKATQHWTADQVAVGIDALLISAEMVIFAFVHIKAFTYLPYRPEGDIETRKTLQTKRWRAMLHVMDFRDVFTEIGSSSKYIGKAAVGKHGLPDDQKHLEQVFGKRRPDVVQEKGDDNEKIFLKKSPHSKNEDVEERLQRARLLDPPAEPLESSPDTYDYFHAPVRWSDDMHRDISFGDVRYPSGAAPTMPVHALYRPPSSQSSAPSRTSCDFREKEAQRRVEVPVNNKEASEEGLYRQPFPPTQFSPRGRIRPLSIHNSDFGNVSYSPTQDSSFYRSPEVGDVLPTGRMRLPRHDLPRKKHRETSTPVYPGRVTSSSTVLVTPVWSQSPTIGPKHPSLSQSNSSNSTNSNQRYVFTQC